jgi:hypothetical protein
MGRDSNGMAVEGSSRHPSSLRGSQTHDNPDGFSGGFVVPGKLNRRMDCPCRLQRHGATRLAFDEARGNASLKTRRCANILRERVPNTPAKPQNHHAAQRDGAVTDHARTTPNKECSGSKHFFDKKTSPCLSGGGYETSFATKAKEPPE